MILPQDFDYNEWFILITITVFYGLIFLLPKRFPLSVSIIIMLFTSTVARLSDHLLSGAIIGDVYDIMDTNVYELFDFLTYVTYGPFGYFLFYLYDLFKPKSIWLVGYIFLWSLASMGFEGISAFFEVFHYNGWKLTYSFSFYLIVIPIALGFCVYVKQVYQSYIRNN
ncbi:hypothetical protein [Aquibacillus sediminis]|uniref:hypothetical protein n=1 Tax=Aquibacillus sediminis TaxID=2574734 RepID=UPI001107B729|nr:hypothetical protein [Aquibacillus sediminis]